MKYRYIAVEGNIGSGKTTLATKLAKHYNARVILEEFGDNPFLAKFYKEPLRYAFPLELAFLADRFQQLKSVLHQQDMFQEKIISDYIFPKTKIFAKINLPDKEYDLFARMAEFLKLDLAVPDLLIFLHCDIEKLQQNIKTRGRRYEQDIKDDYLKELEGAYHQYLNQETVKVLHIDVSEVDLRDQDKFLQLVQFLDSDNDFKQYHLKI